MEHQKAIETMAAERYLLGELNEEEANAFEEHYFGCRSCADAVRDGTTLIESGKELVGEAKVVRWRWPVALPTAAALALAAVVGYVSLVVIPRVASNVPTVVPIEQTAVLITFDTRAAAAPAELTFHGPHPLAIGVDVPQTSEPYVRYRFFLRGANGEEFPGGEVSAEEAKTNSVTLSVRPLPAGTYVLVIEGVRKEGNRTEIARSPIEVKRVE